MCMLLGIIPSRIPLGFCNVDAFLASEIFQKIDLVCITVRKLLRNLRGLTQQNFISQSSLHAHFRLTRRFVLIVGGQAPRLRTAPSGNMILWSPQQREENGAITPMFSSFCSKVTHVTLTFCRPKQVIWPQLTSKATVLPYAWKSEWDINTLIST